MNSENPKDDELAVGKILKKRRQALRLSLPHVEMATKIRGKYLVKLETGDYTGLPNDIYMRGFVQNYADYLGLNGNLLAKQFAAEHSIVKARPAKQTAVKNRRFIITPKLIIFLGSLAMMGLIVAYLSWQFAGLAAAPKLDIFSPTGDQVIYGSLVEISGHASGGADVTVNDSPVLTDGNGNFTDKLALQDGLNAVRITAKNRLGKTTTVSRNILAHLPKTIGETAAVPTDKFDGVAVGVNIKDSATWLVVEVDSKEAFRGTMLAGTSQSFKGTSRIKLTTGNAGATSLTITNTAVASKAISPVGKNGEIRRDLDFSKETVIQ